MIEAISFAAIGGFLKKNWIWLALAAAAVAVLTLTYCAGGQGQVVKDQAKTIKTQQQVGGANDKAAAARVQDAVKSQQQKVELDNALKNATSPDDARRRTGCVILRQQGRDTTTIPACAGL